MDKIDKDCIFCKIAKKEIAASFEYENEEVVAFNDKNAQAPVHILIVPKRHIAKVHDITADTMGLIAKMTIAAKEIAKKKGVLDSGYRLVINCGKDSGQLVEHLHMHLLGGRSLGWPPG